MSVSYPLNAIVPDTPSPTCRICLKSTPGLIQPCIRTNKSTCSEWVHPTCLDLIRVVYSCYFSTCPSSGCRLELEEIPGASASMWHYYGALAVQWIGCGSLFLFLVAVVGGIVAAADVRNAAIYHHWFKEALPPLLAYAIIGLLFTIPLLCIGAFLWKSYDPNFFYDYDHTHDGVASYPTLITRDSCEFCKRTQRLMEQRGSSGGGGGGGDCGDGFFIVPIILIFMGLFVLYVLLSGADDVCDFMDILWRSNRDRAWRYHQVQSLRIRDQTCVKRVLPLTPLLTSEAVLIQVTREPDSPSDVHVRFHET